MKRFLCWRAGLTFVILVGTSPAWASLGQDVASVESDRASVDGRRSVLAVQDYDVHEITAPTGTVIREYVLRDGTVFAVSWIGPFIPDLRMLLGTYFDSFERAARGLPASARRVGQGSIVVRAPHVVVESQGHMRAFFGRAYIPELVPESVLAEGLK